MTYRARYFRGNENDNLLSDVESVYQAQFDASGQVTTDILISGNNTLEGGGGNDTLHGAHENDHYDGGEGNDRIVDSEDTVWFGEDWYNGKHLVYYKTFLSGNDTLYGGDGDDYLESFGGLDVLYGDAGNDTIHGGRGADIADGGSGNDFLLDLQDPKRSYTTFEGSVGMVAPFEGYRFDVESPIDLLNPGTLQFEYHQSGNDTFSGGDGNDFLSSLDGNDQLFGENDNDTLDGGDGNDLLSGGDGNDVLEDLEEHYAIHYADGMAMTLYLGGGNDTLLGGNGSDSLNAGIGNDVLYGEGQADFLQGGAGADFLDGGDGNDVLTDRDSIRKADSPVTAGDINSESDTLRGGNGDDTITGGPGDDQLFGGDGNDILTDEGSVLTDDGLIVFSSYDFIDGGAGNDVIKTREGYDTIQGGAGNDIIVADFTSTVSGGSGADIFGIWEPGRDRDLGVVITDFEKGVDKIDLTGWGFNMLSEHYLTMPTAVAYSYGHNSAHQPTTIIFMGDYRTSIHLEGTIALDGKDFIGWESGGEETLIGTHYNDEMYGGNDDDSFDGDAGNDTISGGKGNDQLIGGNGNDSLLGGAGNDMIWGGEGRDSMNAGSGRGIFFYDELEESTPYSRDFIHGFSQGEDKIDLSALGFTGIRQGAASGSVLGFVHRFGDTHILNQAGTFEIEIDGLLNLNSSDFIFN